MDYKDLIIVIILLILIIVLACILIFLFLKVGFNFIVSSNIHNKDIEVKVSLRCFFNLINISKVIYTIKKSGEFTNNKKSKRKKSSDKEDKNQSKFLHLKKIELEDLLVLFRLLKKVNIVEINSNLEYGTQIIELNSAIYVIVNIIYGNIFNYFNSKKIYLKVTPCYTKDYINYKGTVHIRPTFKDIISIAIAMLRIYIKIKKYARVKHNKEEEVDEISQLYKKFNGYNS
ncbi:MAG: hypothetical protein ACRCX2_26955 [Paraclostridium sp.]